MEGLKLFACAVIASAGALAWLGVTTASADVICTTSSNPCSTKITKVESSMSGGSSNITDTSGNSFTTCTVGTLNANIESQGSGINPSGKISSLTWGPSGAGCNTTVDTTKNGSIETRTEGGEATIWIKDTEFTTVAFGVTCTYGPGSIFKKLGRWVLGAIAHTVIDHILKKLGGSFLCPETARWSGSYAVTNHSSAFVTNE